MSRDLRLARQRQVNGGNAGGKPEGLAQRIEARVSRSVRAASPRREARAPIAGPTVQVRDGEHPERTLEMAVDDLVREATEEHTAQGDTMPLLDDGKLVGRLAEFGESRSRASRKR